MAYLNRNDEYEHVPTEFGSPFPQLSPREYAEIISRHAKRATHQSLFPGQNFEDLAQHFQNSLQRPETQDITRYLPSSLSLATLCTLNEIERYVYELKDSHQCKRILEAGSKSTDSYILFLKGIPSSEWLTTVGSICQVEPEYFQRHLSFQSRFDYFSLPSLPSCSDNIIRLPFVTLCSREDKIGKSNQGIIDELRMNGDKAMDIYTHQLKVDAAVGDSIVRRYSVHDEMHFSLEQDMTISLNQVGESWIALVALDAGKDLGESLEGPWRTGIDHKSPWKTRVYPIIQYRPGIVLHSDSLALPYKDNKIGMFPQTASLLHKDYGKLLDVSVMRLDPFYALHELFAFCASSELQFLNMIDSKISSETGYAMLRSAPALSNLLYNREILESHAVRLREVIAVIRRRGSPEWPQILGAEERKIADAAKDKLERDYEHLLYCVHSLLDRCDKGMQVVLSKASISQAELAFSQSARVARLTQLAFFYIPFSFMASVFGMNVVEFGTGKLRLWVWLATSIPIFLVSVVFLVVDMPGFIRRMRLASPLFLRKSLA